MAETGAVAVASEELDTDALHRWSELDPQRERAAVAVYLRLLGD
jgi:hypothetical protein